LIIDELGYLPFDPNAAHLFFQLVSSSSPGAPLPAARESRANRALPTAHAR
jgi:hypothetical protein